MKDRTLNNIIDALSQHENSSAVGVLERVGTNCEDDEVRLLTARALIKRNTAESLTLVIAQAGKGINDLSTNVAMSSINELLGMKNKEVALKILDEVRENHAEESVKETARSVKALMAFS